VVSDENVEVWKQLERDYNSLKDLLGKRASMIKDVDQMNSRNAEMKKLLNQYLGDVTANSGLQIPPAQVMKVRTVSVAAANKQKSGNGHDNNVLFSQTNKLGSAGKGSKDAMRATR
jgi:hypothetical protein